MYKFAKNWRKYLEEGELSTSGITSQKGLHPKFWFRRELDSKVRRKLVKIAQDVAKDLEIYDFIDDIILTGSIATYNWHTLSDIDLHILLDFRKVDKNVKLVKKYLDSQKTLWNKNHVYGLAEKTKGKIKTMRASGLSSGGIYSAENLAFKILRNNGLLQLLSSLKSLSYDRLMSSGDVKINIG